MGRAIADNNLKQIDRDWQAATMIEREREQRQRNIVTETQKHSH